MDTNTAKISKGKKRSVWSDGDVQVLLELWAERATDLRRAKRNGHIYKDIAVQMNNKFSPEEVHTKIRNFTQKYREEKKEMGPSGGSPSTWKFYGAVHQIIGSTAANCAEITESFLFVNSSDTSSQLSPVPLTSPVPQPLPSPVLTSSSLSPLSIDTTFPSAAATPSSSGKKRNHLGEVVNMMREQNEMLKTVVEGSQSLSNEMMKAIREQNDTTKEFMNLMKHLIDKI